MDTLAINPTITTLFAALGAIGSLWIHVAKKFDPAFRVKFDTVWTDEERQAYTLRVGGVLIVIGSALWLGWRYINGDFPADPRDAVVFALGAVGQLISNAVGYLTGNVAAFQSLKHLMAKPAPSTPIVNKINIDQPVDLNRLRWEIAGAIDRREPGADDSERGGGAA